jgi:hypothetical protein
VVKEVDGRLRGKQIRQEHSGVMKEDEREKNAFLKKAPITYKLNIKFIDTLV